MEPKDEPNREHPHQPTTKPTAAIPPTSATLPRKDILRDAHHNDIHHNTFVTKVTADPLDVLHRRVAPNAILNAGGRADEVRCHPGTREEVIGRIEKWGDMQDGLTEPIFWLSGPAGAGKSAIVQTVAEGCDQRKIPHANFFFFRADTSRSHASSLVATLLHQIILLYPLLRDAIAKLLSTNPLIFDSILETQLAQLIVAPLRTIQQSSADYHPLVLLIDGLDECDSESKRSQHQILHAFDQVLAEQPCPLRLLVASRDESQIRAAFNRMSSLCLQLYLDGQYSPESDIRLFVDAQFKQVRQTHPLAYMLDESWPSVNDINHIVEKSSGQFIYAATAMRFILESSASPILSMERVRGTARLATRSPFSHLDALYTYILSQVDDQEALKDVLHAALSNRGLPFLFLTETLELYNQKYSLATVLSCVADMTPIALYDFDSHELLFYHASFSDYLLDQSRSREYFVDIPAFFYNFLPIVWKTTNNPENPLRSTDFTNYGLFGLKRLKRLPPGLLDMVAKCNEYTWTSQSSDTSILKAIFDLCANDNDVHNYRHIIRKWFDDDRPRVGHRGSDSNLPFSHRYFHMARGRRNLEQAPDTKLFNALSLETEFDRHELTLWLNDLLHDLHLKLSGNIGLYKQPLNTWISWAVQKDIPCNGLYDLLYARRYIGRNMVKKWAMFVEQVPDLEIFNTLCVEAELDRNELALWLNDLLHDLHSKPSVNVKLYKQLLNIWISWAVQKDIPCNGLYNLPYARQYIWRNTVKKWATLGFNVGRK